MPLETVRKVFKVAKEPLSLETPIGDEEDFYLGDLIEDKTAILLIDAATVQPARDDNPRAGVLYAARGARAAHALWHRHKFRPHAGRGRPTILGDRERIRQIEAKGLRKLKTPAARQEF